MQKIDNRITCRVKMTGTFRGIAWEYMDPPDLESQYIWLGESGTYAAGDPSDYWWRDGNMSCDCNRECYLPEKMKAMLRRRGPNSPHEEGQDEFIVCGEEIKIDLIEPIGKGPSGETLPSLWLCETVGRYQGEAHAQGN